MMLSYLLLAVVGRVIPFVLAAPPICILSTKDYAHLNSVDVLSGERTGELQHASVADGVKSRSARRYFVRVLYLLGVPGPCVIVAYPQCQRS